MTHRAYALLVLLALTAMFVLASPASATGSTSSTPPDTTGPSHPHPPHPPHPPGRTGSQASADADATATSGAWAYGSGGAGGAGGAGGQAGAYNAFSDGGSRMYVMPAPVYAAALPPGLCPKGDSMSWSFGWNFISYATSSTRTELECLERVLAVMKANHQPVVEQRLPPLKPNEPLHPPAKKPAKAKKAEGAPLCATQCTPKKIT